MGGAPVSLTTTVGELAETRVSADGRLVVSTLVDVRRSLMAVPVRFDQPPEPRPLTDGDTGDSDPSIDPKSGRLVFSSSRSGNRNLWIAGGDHSNATPLTTERYIDERPAFSPDGTQVAFVSDRGTERGIWTIPAQGGAPHFVGAAVTLGPLTWMPDGKRIMFTRPGGVHPTLAMMSVADGRVEPFATPGASAAPAWSAATRRLAYLEAATTRPVRTLLTFLDETGQRLFADFPRNQAINNGMLAWAPDGRRLAALAIPGNGNATIWIAEPEGREPLRKLIDLPISVLPHGITWSADGSEIVVAYQESSSDIVLFDLIEASR